MNGYTKLFGSIIASTIWREDDKTRIVWITMLAMANQYGEVEASLPGLADMARVSITEAEKAMAILSSPDSYSRTKDNDGRRIAEIDGGWRILNHGKYREKMNKDERREYLRKKQAEHRERRRLLNPRQQPVNNSQQLSTVVNPSSDSSTPSTHAEAEAEAEAEALSETVVCVVNKPSTSDLEARVRAIQDAYPDRQHPTETRMFILDAIHDGTDPDTILAGTKLAVKLITERYNGGVSNRYAPKAKGFFKSKGWQTPEISFAREEDPTKRPTQGHRIPTGI